MTANEMCRQTALVLCFALLSCKAAPPPADATPVAGDSAGIAIVNNRAPVWTDATRWKLDAVPLTSIGGDENDVQQQFRFIRAARRLSNGNVVIGVDNELRLFGPDGKFLRTIAGKGNGPGEFQSIGDVWRLNGDTILASQAIAEGGMKNVLINPDGSYAREERPDGEKYRALGRWGECARMVLPDRSRISCQNDSSIPLSATNRVSKIDERGMSSPGPGLLRQLKRLYLVPPSLDTAYPIGITAGIEQFGVTINGKSHGFVIHPFYSRSIIAAGGSPLRIVTLQNPEYELLVWTPTGQLERVIRRAGGRRAPNPQELSDAADALRKSQQRDQHQQDPVIAAQIVAAVPTPDSLPAALAVVVSSAGEILVAREGNLPSHASSLYDVFDAKGQYLGELRLPRRSGIREVGG